MIRVSFYIDGFNLYHVIASCHPVHMRWCNYRALAAQFLRPGEILQDVYCFTALVPWDDEKKRRHTLFLDASRHAGVTIVLGQFKRSPRQCRFCRREDFRWEEKESDVNLAISFVSHAIDGKFDKAFIVSADSDFVPVLQTVKARHPNLPVGTLIPYNPRQPHIANHIRRVSDFSRNIERHHLHRSRLPHSISLDNGRTVVCPCRYWISG